MFKVGRDPGVGGINNYQHRILVPAVQGLLKSLIVSVTKKVFLVVF